MVLKDQYEFEEGRDYKLVPVNLRGGTDYMLKPEIFKMLLMRSRNTRKYAEYYLLLEKDLRIEYIIYL